MQDQQRLVPSTGQDYVTIGQALAAALADLGQPHLAATALVGAKDAPRGNHVEFDMNPRLNKKAKAFK